MATPHVPEMTTCPNCRARAPASRRYCDQCGTPLRPSAPPPERLTCPRCGLVSRPGAQYCGRCGTQLTPPSLEDTQPIPVIRSRREHSPATVKASASKASVAQTYAVSQAKPMESPVAAPTAQATPVPATALPQPAAKGSVAAGGFAGLVCFLDGLLLLGVAVTQLASGGLGTLVGLWNIAVTAAYMVTAMGLASRKEWGYRWGLGLALVNIGLLFSQAAFWGAVGASEDALYPLFILIVGDLVLAGTLLAVKNAAVPSPQPEEIITPPALVAELDKALRKGARVPASPEHIPVQASLREPAVTMRQGLITPEERDLLVAVRKAFIADQSKRRLVQVRTDLEIEGEHIDLITRDWSNTVFTLGRVPSQIHIYLFRPVVDEDLVKWMKRTVWKKEGGYTAIITIAASQRALETGGGGLFDAGKVGVYALRDGAKCKKRSARNVVSVFEKWYKKYKKGRQR